MTAAMIAEIIWTVLGFVGCSVEGCPGVLEALLDARSVEQVRRERHMSVEERRLDRFWRDFHGVQARYYQELGKLDWIAYYKNHGVQINVDTDSAHGGPSRIQFAPVFMAPRLECFLPGGAASGVPSVQYQPAARPLPPFVQASGPGCDRVVPAHHLAPPPLDREEVSPRRGDWEKYYTALRRYYDQLDKVDWVAYYKDRSGDGHAPVSAKWTVRIEMIEAQPAGASKNVRVWSGLRINEKGVFVADRPKALILATGTAKDLLEQAPFDVQRLEDATQVGASVHGKITALSPGRARLDLTLQQHDLESAGKQGVVISGKTFRIAQQLQCGQRTRVVLQNNAAGAPALWLELLVAEVEATMP